jgi:hypothetical protein
MRTNDLQETDEPIVKWSMMLMHELMRTLPNTLKVEPRRAYALMDMDEPKAIASIKLKADPRRTVP